MARARRTLTNATLLAAALVMLSGCAALIPGSGGPHVAPFLGTDTAALSADQIVDVMQAAGFGPAEIELLGAGLRNALAQQGAARILGDDHTEAIFAVHDHYVDCASWRRGEFMYNLGTGKLR